MVMIRQTRYTECYFHYFVHLRRSSAHQHQDWPDKHCAEALGVALVAVRIKGSSNFVLLFLVFPESLLKMCVRSQVKSMVSHTTIGDFSISDFQVKEIIYMAGAFQDRPQSPI